MRGDPFVILVTGSRHATMRLHGEQIRSALDVAKREKDVLLMHGAAPGADLIAASIGAGMGWAIDPYPADWDMYGRAAGPMRNIEMVDKMPDVVLAFPMEAQVNKGTMHCANYAEKQGLKVYKFWLDALPED